MAKLNWEKSNKSQKIYENGSISIDNKHQSLRFKKYLKAKEDFQKAKEHLENWTKIKKNSDMTLYPNWKQFNKLKEIRDKAWFDCSKK